MLPATRNLLQMAVNTRTGAGCGIERITPGDQICFGKLAKFLGGFATPAIQAPAAGGQAALLGGGGFLLCLFLVLLNTDDATAALGTGLNEAGTVALSTRWPGTFGTQWGNMVWRFFANNIGPLDYRRFRDQQLGRRYDDLPLWHMLSGNIAIRERDGLFAARLRPAQAVRDGSAFSAVP